MMGEQNGNTIASHSANDSRLSLKHMLGYSQGVLGLNVSFAMVSSYLSYFYTDVFLLAPAVMAVLFLSCRIWDGINDPVMGLIVDSTNSRWGRFRPYLLFAPFLMLIFFSLTFYVPDMSMAGKIVWAFVTYFALQMTKTLLTIPYYALPAVMTTRSEERTKISSFQNIFNGGIMLLIGALTLPLVQLFSSEKEGFFYVAIIFGIFSMFPFWIAYRATKTFDNPSRLARLASDKTNTISTRKKLAFFFGNTPLMKLFVPLILYFTNTTIVFGMGIYFFKYNINSYDKYPIFMGMLVIGLILGAAAAPVVIKKFGKIKVLHISNILFMALHLVMFFIAVRSQGDLLAHSWSLGGISFILMMLAIFVGAFLNVVLPVMVLDCVEYGEWKSKVRMEGLINSAFLISAKAGLAVGGLIIGAGLSFVGYIPNQETYSNRTLLVIAALFLLLPAIAKALISVIMVFYDLDETKHQQIVAELAAR